jgi:hypothetical protein
MLEIEMSPAFHDAMSWSSRDSHEADQLERVGKAVEKEYDCTAVHVATLPIEELFPHSPWSGYLELFRLMDHPTATRCYAWPSSRSSAENAAEQLITVLEGPLFPRTMSVPKTVILRPLGLVPQRPHPATHAAKQLRG